MLKVSVFDFDGTIANSIPVSIKVLQKLAQEDFNKKIDDKLVSELRDKPIPEVFKELGISIVKLPFIAMRARKELNKQISHLKPIRGMRTVLSYLKSQGQILGILSSNSKESIEMFLSENEIEDFDFVYSNSKVFGKASSLKKILKEYKCQNNEVVYLGDEIRDIEAAKSVGMSVISVTWGVNSKEKLIGYKPDFLVESPSEIIDIYKNMLASKIK